MAFFLIMFTILLLSLICIIAMCLQLRQQPPISLSKTEYIKLIFSGILAFIADTIGIGSFAVNVALAKLLKTFSDDELPGAINGAQIIPGVIEAFFFLKIVNVDLATLLTLIGGTCFGGLIGGAVISRLSKQKIRLTMIVCFMVLIGLLIGHQLQLMPIGGELMALHSYKLIIGFLAMIVCGTLTSAGIGLFVMVQSVLFLLGISPVIAFPIMMAAGAMQQPLTTLVFVQQNKIPLKKALILSFAGCIGVGITLPLFTQLSSTWLHCLLLIILIYNFIAMGRTYLANRLEQRVKIPYAIAE